MLVRVGGPSINRNYQLDLGGTCGFPLTPNITLVWPNSLVAGSDIAALVWKDALNRLVRIFLDYFCSDGINQWIHWMPSQIPPACHPRALPSCIIIVPCPTPDARCRTFSVDASTVLLPPPMAQLTESSASSSPTCTGPACPSGRTYWVKAAAEDGSHSMVQLRLAEVALDHFLVEAK